MLLSTFGTGTSPALTTQRKFSVDFYSKYQLLLVEDGGYSDQVSQKAKSLGQFRLSVRTRVSIAKNSCEFELKVSSFKGSTAVSYKYAWTSLF